MSACKHFKAIHPCSLRHNSIANPLKPEKSSTYLLILSSYPLLFRYPSLGNNSCGFSINMTPGHIYWLIFHRVLEKDLTIECHVRKAPKISYQALHSETTNTLSPCSINFPSNHHHSCSPIFSGIYNNFIISELNLRLVVGNKCQRKIASGCNREFTNHNGKIEFLNLFSDCLSDWRESKKHGLSRQSFDALVFTILTIADLSSDLLNEVYKYILTGRLLSEPLERRLSQYRQCWGGRFLSIIQNLIQC